MMKNTDENQMAEDAGNETENGDCSATYLTFRIDRQYYGIQIGNVIEILQIQSATELPEMPYYSKGIINLRGRVIPLIDVNLRFGRPEKEYNDRACIIIVDVDGPQTGLIVDAVEGVVTIGAGVTCAPPAFRADHSARYITHVARIDKDMVLLLDARLLVSKTEPV